METYDFALLILISIYKNRPDLQKAFPEVFNGKLERLLDWAISCGITIDSSKPLLCFFEDELRSILEDWIILGLKLGHRLPVIDGINLNKKPKIASVASL